MATGRPREFDIEQALESALRVFWKKGYEGTTLPDLTEAMGINRPSLYAAFGNKETLFRKAMERYIDGAACHVTEALSAPTTSAVMERLLYGSIDLTTDSRNPRGCFMVQGALACGDTADCVRQELIKRRSAAETAIRKRFERAVTEGDLPESVNPADLALYVVIVIHGMAVQAASGASRADLRRVADVVLRNWPMAH